jgi:hypothetical protein
VVAHDAVFDFLEPENQGNRPGYGLGVIDRRHTVLRFIVGAQHA